MSPLLKKTSLRTHPISIAFSLKKYFWVLLIPIIRAVLALGFDITGAFKGAFVDLTIILLLLSRSILQWYFTRIDFDGDFNFVIERGILIKQKAIIPFDNISTISLSKNLLHVLLKTEKMCIYSATKPYFRPIIKVYLKPCQIKLINEITHDETAISQKSPDWYSVITYAFLSSSGLGGVLFLSALISGLGIVLGEQLNNKIYQSIDKISKDIALGIPPLLVALGIVIFAGWFVSFLLNIGSLIKFTATRRESFLQIDCGFAKKSRVLLNLNKITFLDNRKSFISFILRCGAIHVGCIGYGAEKHAVNLFYPNARNENNREAKDLLLGEFIPVKLALKANKKSFFRFIFTPCVFLLISAAAIFTVHAMRIKGILVFLIYLLPLPMVWWLIASIVCYYKNGIGIKNNQVTMCYKHRFTFHKISFNSHDAGYVELCSNPFQKKAGVCNLKVKIVSQKKSGAGNIRVLNLDKNSLINITDEIIC